MLEQNINQDLLAKFKQTITDKIGLVISGRQDRTLLEVLQSRFKALKINSPEEYLLELQYGARSGPEDEWEALSEALTIGESYFFRDQGLFSIFRKKLFPELIKKKSMERRLNIWSAGCAAGEEPYSIAIMIDRNWPELADWDVRILGTDINLRSISAAREGRYGTWAFRNSPPWLREAYFRSHETSWLISPHIREMVDFQPYNLADSGRLAPRPAVGDFDLIICRNVFIYFMPETIQNVITKFSSVMSPGGYMVTGHGEISLISNQSFESVRFDEAIVFRRILEGDRRAPSRPPGRFTCRPAVGAPIIHNARSRINDGSNIVSRRAEPRRPRRADQNRPVETGPVIEDENRLKELLAMGRNGEVVEQGEKLLNGPTDPSCGLLLVIAQAQANLGRLERAEEFCRSVMSRESFSARPHWILAQVALERGRNDEARELLRKVLYLDQKHVAAYLELADLHQAASHFEKAKKLRKAALAVLDNLPASVKIEYFEDYGKDELAEKIRLLIN